MNLVPIVNECYGRISDVLVSFLLVPPGFFCEGDVFIFEIITFLTRKKLLFQDKISLGISSELLKNGPVHRNVFVTLGSGGNNICTIRAIIPTWLGFQLHLSKV